MKRFSAFLALAIIVGCGSEGPPPAGRLSANAAGDPPAAQGEDAPPAAVRNIIYNGDLDLVVEDFSPLAERVPAVAEQFGGFVAKSLLKGRTGQPRGGQWTVRVPADRFAAAFQALQELGEIRKAESHSKDVTAEFQDLEARLRNKRQEEDRLLVHLEKTTARLEDILLVEKELSRVRGEVEQMQGRLRLLTDLTSLSTITVSIQEIRDYKPEPPTFAARMARSWTGSLDALLAAGQSLAVGLVAATPWLAVIAVPCLPAWLGWRRLRRKRRTPPPLKTA